MDIDPNLPLSRVMAELLRIQRWAGGDTVPAARAYGLYHGFESILDEECEAFGISRELQDKVEDMLEDVEAGKQSPAGMAIKQRLHRDDIDETAAAHVIELCRLQSRFVDAYNKLTASNSYFSHLKARRPPERDWVGALHYIELVDCTEEAHKQLHACFSPSVPRIGEVVTPENGSPMRVVDVEYKIVRHGQRESDTFPVLTPFVYLEGEEDTDD